MKILIIGGTGNISWQLTAAACRAGWNVTLLNRGSGTRRAAPPACREVPCDIRDGEAVRSALRGESYDAVVDFLCYTEAHARNASTWFRDRVGHYVFISTTALYDRSLARRPLDEEAPRVGPDGWDYAVAKAQAERIFAEARIQAGFPVSVIRPAHTYDTIIPEAVGNGDWTNLWRTQQGKPIVVHGDGTTLWTLTHSRDLADGIVAFLSAGCAPGQTVHLTSDETYTWREITDLVYEAAGIGRPTVCYRTTAQIDRVSPRLGNGIKGHKMWCDIYDNTRFRTLCPEWRAAVPLSEGIRRTLGYFRSRDGLTTPNAALDAVLDEICRTT